MNFQKNLDFGKTGESIIANYLKNRGWAILPVYEKIIDEGKGPQIFVVDRDFIAPDMLAFTQEDIYFVEAKHKSVFSWYRKTQKWVTGMDIKHYKDYLEVDRRFPFPVWLFFLHTERFCNKRDEPYPCNTGLYAERLSVLKNKESHTSDKWGNSGMVYWAEENLKKLCELDKLDVAI